MKVILPVLLLLSTAVRSYGQLLNSVITPGEVSRIESTLSADDMQGRKTFTPGNAKAAAFINEEFKRIGLKTLDAGSSNYLQPFSMVKAKLVSSSAYFGSDTLDPKNFFVFTCLPEINITSKSGFKKVTISATANFIESVTEFGRLKENLIVFADPSFSKYFAYLPRIGANLFKSDKSVVFVLGKYDTDDYEIKAKNDITEQQAANVVGVIPGKSKQVVVFSGHYDHLGVEANAKGDTIFNGANDDASGTTAVISLAEYYKAAHNNERALIFVAFTAEEIGGYGSQYFSRQLEPDNVVAMFNIEMIGTESKWGRNSAYITGFEKSNLGGILQANLKGSEFSFYPDPYTEQHLFYRSDNATLARLGVPAHTISTSKMDNEPNYHKLSDEIKTLDISNMTSIIKSVITSAQSIVSGKDTPTRVDASALTK